MQPSTQRYGCQILTKLESRTLSGLEKVGKSFFETEWWWDRMPGIRCQHQPPRGPAILVHPHASWWSSSFYLFQTPRISKPLLFIHSLRKTRPWTRPHFPLSLNLFIWKVGNLDYMDFSLFQLSYLRMCQTFLEAKHPAPPCKSPMSAGVKTTELPLSLLVQASLISTHV